MEFGPYEGPYLPGGIRLYVDGGALVGEVPGDWVVNSPRVFGRNGEVLVEVTADLAWRVGDAFTYTELEL